MGRRGEGHAFLYILAKSYLITAYLCRTRGCVALNDAMVMLVASRCTFSSVCVLLMHFYYPKINIVKAHVYNLALGFVDKCNVQSLYELSIVHQCKEIV